MAWEAVYLYFINCYLNANHTFFFLQEVLEEKVDAIEAEEEMVLESGEQLAGSMVGRRRILCTWAVGEAWERFCKNHLHVIQRAFTAVGLSLPIDGSRDSEISIKGLDTSIFLDALKECAGMEENTPGGAIEDEDDMEELESAEDELDGEYLVGEVD